MNWAQVIAACIIALVTLLNIFFTVSGNRESRKSEVRQKYVDRQSDALEVWWLMTIRSSLFNRLCQTEQDELIRRIIWLPSDVRVAAEKVIQEDNKNSREILRSRISFFLKSRTDQGD